MNLALFHIARDSVGREPRLVLIGRYQRAPRKGERVEMESTFSHWLRKAGRTTKSPRETTPEATFLEVGAVDRRANYRATPLGARNRDLVPSDPIYACALRAST